MAEKISSKIETDKPLSAAELKANSAEARAEQHDGSLAVTPETQGGPPPRLEADIRAILRNKAIAKAQEEAEAKFDAEYDEQDAKDLPQTLEEALIVTREPVAYTDLRTLPGYLAATQTAQDEFDRVLMRPGTLVEATENVYDASDLKELKTLDGGTKVPDASVGFISAHFIVEARRQRILAGA